MDVQKLLSRLSIEGFTHEPGDTAENGIFTMSEQRITENVELLNSLGFDVTEELYTNAVLDAVYADGTQLYEE